MAAYYGHAEICKMLLDHGVDVNCLDKHDTSSLHGAVYGGSFDVCQLLLDRGARFQEREGLYWFHI
ncbi:ankyrin repeat-containing domain protein [Gorgonomyces haynaldii]|nr:ankyrin repeat-containing domain protein [Gorgonomyces haynaldii]